MSRKGIHTKSDKERVLMNIVCETSSCYDEPRRTKSGWPIMFRFGHVSPQFMPLEAASALSMPLKQGDIVRCETNPHHDWGISEFVEERDNAFILREIGSDRLLRMGNERFTVLRFMSPSLLYTGKKYQLYKWAYRAFAEKGKRNPAADYFKRCGGVELDGSTLVIWSRPHIWAGQEKKGPDGQTLYAQPRRFVIPWDKNTRLKDIIQGMLDQGFAEPYEYAPTKPETGMGGVTTFTRESLMSALGGIADSERTKNRVTDS